MQASTMIGSSGRVQRALWIVAASLAVTALAVCLARLPNPPQAWPSPDIDVYREGARLLLAGENPYGRPLGFGQLPYTYPPFSLIVFIPLAFFWPGLLVLAVTNTVILAVAIWVVLRDCVPSPVPILGISGGHAAMGAGILLGAQFLQPVATNILFGQVNVVLMTLVLLDFIVIPARARGVLTGVAAMIKLIPLIFVAYIIWSRQWNVLRTFLVTCLGCVFVAFLVMPSVSWDYVTRRALDPEQPGRTLPMPLDNQSLNAALLRYFGDQHNVVLGMWVLLSLLVLSLLALALCALRPGDVSMALCFVAMAGLLISPVSWPHHWVWVVPLTAASLCNVRRFPLLVFPVLLLWAVMLGDPWFLRFLAGLPPEPSVKDVLWAHGFILAGLLTLMTGAAYGLVRVLRGRHGGTDGALPAGVTQ